MLFCIAKWKKIARMAIPPGLILDNDIREKGITFASAASTLRDLKKSNA